MILGKGFNYQSAVLTFISYSQFAASRRVCLLVIKTKYPLLFEDILPISSVERTSTIIESTAMSCVAASKFRPATTATVSSK